MLLIVLTILGATVYLYYKTLVPKGLMREFVISTALLILVAGVYGALALGIEIPAVNSFIHELIQGIIKR